jgi:hypothetical protein
MRIYALTSRHVFQVLNPNVCSLRGRNGQAGRKPARIKDTWYPSSPTDGAVDTDIIDLCAIDFADDIGLAFCAWRRQRWHELTRTRPDRCRCPEGKVHIVPPDITIGCCRLEFTDKGASTSDPFLCLAVAEYREPPFSSITGISGSPVFDRTANELCGMVVRGRMNANRCTIHYIDVSISCIPRSNKRARNEQKLREDRDQAPYASAKPWAK